MRKKIRHFIPTLELLSSLTPKESAAYLKNGKPDIIKFITDILYNVNCGTLKVDSSILFALKPHKKIIQRLCQKKLSLNERRKIISKLNFFSTIVAPIVPILVALVAP